MKLSRDLIIQTAMTLVDRDGLDALSMRRLAQELDVWPMAMYRWFDDKDELVAALAEAAADRVAVPRPDGPWRARLEALLLDARDALAAHGPAAGEPLGRLAVPLLLEAGLDEREAERTWDALLAMAVGYGPGGDAPYGVGLLLDGLEARAAA